MLYVSGSMAFACQDRYVRVYSIMTSTDHHSIRGCPSYGGQLVKVQFDPSGQYLLTACSLKTINLLQSISYAVKREMAEMGRLTRGMVFRKSWKKSNIEAVHPKRIMSEPNFNSEPKQVPEHSLASINHGLKGATEDTTKGAAAAQQHQDQQQCQQQLQHLQDPKEDEERKDTSKSQIKADQNRGTEALLPHLKENSKCSNDKTEDPPWETAVSRSQDQGNKCTGGPLQAGIHTYR
ncbi:mitogen-activated protein kinase-binding protein 1 [Plakobranchus ocellatus]|uniref:Mitogen-activated protein kinase-binding protein 1 n=1 Tax=Plakobranchus ocellatus TaxID=259542 RepID=A0AAV4AIV4_9GAST|nr:mitogen-activated protein kinase-binding protein 1 [Plakobranchus ocellatus]